MKRFFVIHLLGLGCTLMGAEKEIDQKEAQFKMRIVKLKEAINDTLDNMQKKTVNDCQEINRTVIELKNQAHTIEQNNK